MRELIVRRVLIWSDKHQKLTNEGARIIHVKQLLELFSLELQKEIGNSLLAECSCQARAWRENFPNHEKDCKKYEYAVSFNEGLDKALSIVKGIKE